jgi:hypothetical protein
MLFCIGVQLGLFFQANRKLPGVPEQDCEENIWTLKTGTNKKTQKLQACRLVTSFKGLYSTPVLLEKIK